MSAYEEIVEESGDYRAVIKLDDSAEKPYDDGATPILSREFRGYGARWEAVNSQADDLAGLLNELEQRFEEDDIERFLRIFVGAYSVEWDSSSNCRYLAFDTPEWREKMGLTDEYMAGAELDPSKLAEGSLKEILAWAEGDVWGVGLEKRVRWSTEDEDYEDMDTWEEDEDGFVWGYYGHEYAEQEARDLLKAKLEK